MITTTSFKAIIEAQRRHPTEWLWRQCLSIRSQFCEAVVAAGYLSWEQMVSAACRYRLGASRQGGVIFWQIDQEERVRDGKVMYYGLDCHRLKDKQHHPTWVSSMLRKRDPFYSNGCTSHCFFGLHLVSGEIFTTPRPLLPKRGTSPLQTSTPQGERLKEKVAGNRQLFLCSGKPGHGLNFLSATAQNISPSSFLRPFGSKRPSAERLIPPSSKNICVVEAEKTAFILSERYPQYVWLAAGGLGEVQVDKFRPLRGRRVILFPDTDPEGMAYRRWYEAAQMVMQQPFWEDSPPIRVSTVLEQHASAEQKARKIDLVDFLFDRRTDEKT